jgi:thiol-disulfide isomerase/thioredoxin
MKYRLFFICLFVTACQARQSDLPPVEPIDHHQIQQLIQEKGGSVVLVNIWATWCAPCREEMPALMKVRGEFHDKGFELIFISADDPDLARSKIQQALKEFGVNFPSYINTGSDEALIDAMSPDWNGALPTSFLYDTNGKLVEIMVGSRTQEQFKDAVKKLIAS